MRYEGAIFRPPSEADSLLIQATVGCPHNKCRFCGMYKNKKFKIKPLNTILEDLDQAAHSYGLNPRRLFLPDGNTIIMKTPSLLKILERAHDLFPRLERVTVYGSARFLALKSVDELVALRKAGLHRIHMGLESGDDVTLEAMCKGADSTQSVEAGQKVKAAGMELSLYYLVGIGGRDRRKEHARASAAAINAMTPDFIRLRTYYPVPQAPLFQDIQSGRFQLPSPLEAIEELETLVSGLDTRSALVSDHISNYLNLSGQLPEDKPELLAELREAAQKDDALYRRHLVQL